MANTFAVSRNRLVFGLCLPLAVLLGYLLAEPMDSSSLAVVVMVVSVLFVPLLIKWHHPLLILSWNATINPYFFPGRPYLWMLMSFVSLFFGVLGRSVSTEKRFLYVPSVTKALLCLLGVVLATAFLTGGFGSRVLGSNSYGGKGYYYIIAAVVGYFALTSQPIPRHQAPVFIGMFFLTSLTALVSNLAFKFPSLWFLYDLFPPDFASSQAQSEGATGPTVVRIGGVIWAAQGLYGFMLARYGIRGVFEVAKPWRITAFMVVLFGSLFSGYRSTMLFFGLTFMTLFFIEGLWRTRLAFLILGVGLLVGISAIVFIDRMPLSVQRTLCFLPIKVDPLTRQAAQASTEWRLEMWERLLPDVPKYFFKGKGYALDPQELFLAQESSNRGLMASSEVAAFAGDYHNGPLSLVIPFGLYGVAAFLWLMVAGIRLLMRNHRYGSPELKRVNAFLLALFVAKVIFFVVIFGAVAADLFYFAGILGFSVALNHGEARPAPAGEDAEEEFEIERA
ncbi:MAG: hypothetical protein EXS35_06865 [Pedosphaera sp.]|nr:hypothetical protein [Pedosphaera sp.]